MHKDKVTNSNNIKFVLPLYPRQKGLFNKLQLKTVDYLDLGSIPICESAIARLVACGSQKPMYNFGSDSNPVTSDFFLTFLLSNNTAVFPTLIQIWRSFPVSLKKMSHFICSFTKQYHFSVDSFLYCNTLFKCLLLPPLNTHDVILWD